MPLEAPIEKLITIANSKYVLATVVARRAKQINNGAKVLVDDISGKPIAISFREMAAGVLEYEMTAEAPMGVGPRRAGAERSGAPKA